MNDVITNENGVKPTMDLTHPPTHPPTHPTPEGALRAILCALASGEEAGGRACLAAGAYAPQIQGGHTVKMSPQASEMLHVEAPRGLVRRDPCVIAVRGQPHRGAHADLPRVPKHCVRVVEPALWQ